jgi:hypothetical protein
LSGLSDETEASRVQFGEIGSWKEYRSEFNKYWERWEKDTCAKITSWAEENLGPIRLSTSWVYYPFSGPDFLYPALFFPDAEFYILTGLEPVGEVVVEPEIMEKYVLRASEIALRQLPKFLGMSFFRRNDLKDPEESLTIIDTLLVFLLRLKSTIIDARPIYINESGVIVPIYPGLSESIKARFIRGIRIHFKRYSDSVVKTIYYFSCDLSDSGMKRNPEYLEFLKKLPRPTTFIKAASYLLQYERFSAIREYIIGRSLAIVQDDSGIAIDSFLPTNWDLTFYGHYLGPIKLFAEFFQDNLKNRFDACPVKPLPFGFGYRSRPHEACMIIASSTATNIGPDPTILQSVTIDGLDSSEVILGGGRPEIILRFSAPVDPNNFLAYLNLRDEPLTIHLNEKWDDDHLGVTCVPPLSLEKRGTYEIQLCDRAISMNGMPLVIYEQHPIRVLASFAQDVEPKAIIVDRLNQLVFLCEKSNLAPTAIPCATGRVYPKVGEFRVFDKKAKAKSLFDDSVFFYFTIFQKSESGHSIGFHSMPVLPDGRLAGMLGEPTSHGCVRLSADAARRIYDWASIGTKVIVY